MHIFYKLFNEGFAWLAVWLGLILTSNIIVRMCIQYSGKYKKIFI